MSNSEASEGVSRNEYQRGADELGKLKAVGLWDSIWAKLYKLSDCDKQTSRADRLETHWSIVLD